MKEREEKEPKFFRWIRAVRAEIDRETKGMSPEEWCAYTKARAKKARESLMKIPPEEAERVWRKYVYPEEASGQPRKLKAAKIAARRPKAKSTTKTTASRRKVAKRLAHA